MRKCYLVVLLASLMLRMETGRSQALVGDTVRLYASALPATCNIGDLKTDSATKLLWFCNPANTWSQIGVNATGSFASINLSNLTATAVNVDIVPATDGSSNIGNSSTGMGIFYAQTGVYASNNSALALRSQSAGTEQTASISSGNVSITTGNSSAASAGNTGNIAITTGNAGTGGRTGNSGNITLQTGPAGTTHGVIRLQDASYGTAGNVWVSNDTLGTGNWQPLTLSNANSFSGVLPFTLGGTGQTSAQTALNALAASTASGLFLRGNGTNVTMSAIQGGDVSTASNAGTAAFASTASSAGTAAFASTASVAGTAAFASVAAIATVATAFTVTPTACSANQYADAIASNGNLTCAQITFSQLSGTALASQGGTGVTTVTANTVPYGNGTGAIGMTLAPAQYNVLVGNASGVPVFGQVNLGQTAGVGTSLLPLANGGTNNAALSTSAGGVLFMNSTGAVANMGTGTSGQAIRSAGTGTPVWRAIAPVYFNFTAATGVYTPSVNTLYFMLRMVGGGGGGGGSGTASGNGTAGGATFFGSATNGTVTAAGGGAGTSGSGGGGGGTNGGGNASCPVSFSGNNGQDLAAVTVTNSYGPDGANSFFGPGGFGGNNGGGNGFNAPASSGGGGGGAGGDAGLTVAGQPGGSGASGSYCEMIFSTIAASYSYAIGIAGAKGTAGALGGTGGNGGTGLVIITEYY